MDKRIMDGVLQPHEKGMQNTVNITQSFGQAQIIPAATDTAVSNSTHNEENINITKDGIFKKR